MTKDLIRGALIVLACFATAIFQACTPPVNKSSQNDDRSQNHTDLYNVPPIAGVIRVDSQNLNKVVSGFSNEEDLRFQIKLQAHGGDKALIGYKIQAAQRILNRRAIDQQPTQTDQSSSKLPKVQQLNLQSQRIERINSKDDYLPSWNPLR